MTADSNVHPYDDLAVYALDALDADEIAAVEAHLSGCALCRAELDQHRSTLGRLVTPEEPPIRLRDSLFARIGTELDRGIDLDTGTELDAGIVAERGIVADIDTARARATRPRHRAEPRGDGRTRWGRGRALTLVAAAAVVVVVGIGMWSLGSRQTRNESVGELAEAAAADADATVVTLRDAAGEATARVVLTGDTDYLLFDELQPLPAGRSYQLWRLDGEVPVSLGVVGDASTEAVAVPLPEASVPFALTDEPDEGVPAPTGPIVASS